jgi:hypothetical protein
VSFSEINIVGDLLAAPSAPFKHDEYCCDVLEPQVQRPRSAASTRIPSEGYWGIRSSWPGKITSGSSSTLRLASKMIVNFEGSP